MSLLHAQLLGPPRFDVEGLAVEPPTRKATALLSFLAAEGRTTRADLSVLLWGHGRLQNLRQELHVLRRLPGAEGWLRADRTHVDLVGTSDIEALRRASSEGLDPSRWWRGEPCEGLEGVRTPAFQEWLATLRTSLEADRMRAGIAAARRRLREEDDDGAWAIIAPLLQEAPHEQAVWRAALEVRLFQERHDDAQELLAAAEGRFALAEHPDWTPLIGQLRGPAGRPSLLALPPSARTVLRLICLAPRPLEAGVLSAAAGVSELALPDVMQTLHGAGWLSTRGAPTDSHRHMVMEELTPQARQAVHSRLADALEAAGAPPGRLALHLQGAGRPSSAAYAAEARRTGSISMARRAIATAETTQERVDALDQGIRAAVRGADLEQAERWWAQLREVAMRSQHSVALLRSAMHGALLAARRGDLERAQQRLSEMVGLLGEADPSIHAVRGALAFFAGRPEEARPLLDVGLATRDPHLRILVLNALGAICGLAGDVDAADQRHAEALTEARALGALPLVLMALSNMAATAVRRGDPEEALRRYDEAAPLADEVDDASLRASLRFNVAHARLEAGQLGRARPAVASLLASPLDQPRTRGLGCRVRADLERACGRFHEAAAWSGRAQAAFAEAGDAAQQATSRFNAAQARFRARRAPADRRDMRAALSQIEQLDRADLRAAGRAELALCETDPERVAALVVAQPSTEREWAAAQRAMLLRGAEELYPGVLQQVEGRSMVAMYLDALVARVLHLRGDPRAEAYHGRVWARVEQAAEGLLTSQREALHARVQGWLSEAALDW
ncbi:MAG: hypothetical protein KTR31_21330 [Myxococcales bacterium]|nr:hypothetical protein [Myxococcales bacterium]